MDEMAPRTISLVSYRSTPSQRAHFGIFVPSADEGVGTLIQVVGAPMVGYVLEFKRNYCPDLTQRANSLFALGQVDSANIVDSDSPVKEFVDTILNGNIEIAASEVQPPRISENFMAPVNDVRTLFHSLIKCLYNCLDHQQEMPGVDYGVRLSPRCERVYRGRGRSNRPFQA